jgi:hypothetical protein
MSYRISCNRAKFVIETRYETLFFPIFSIISLRQMTRQGNRDISVFTIVLLSNYRSRKSKDRHNIQLQTFVEVNMSFY